MNEASSMIHWQPTSVLRIHRLYYQLPGDPVFHPKDVLEQQWIGTASFGIMNEPMLEWREIPVYDDILTKCDPPGALKS